MEAKLRYLYFKVKTASIFADASPEKRARILVPRPETVKQINTRKPFN